ncbi:hypothetical protein ACSEUW_23725, partial [Pseudomonas aeruginosa]
QRGITVRMRVEWVSESAWNPQPVTEAAYLRFINELPLSKFIHAAPSRASGQNHADCEPSVFDCKPLHLVRPFPQRMKSWPIYRQGQPSFDE